MPLEPADNACWEEEGNSCLFSTDNNRFLSHQSIKTLLLIIEHRIINQIGLITSKSLKRWWYCYPVTLTFSPTCCQYWRSVLVLIELQVLPDELVDEQVFVGQRWTRFTLVIQGAEHLCPDTSFQLAQNTAGLQCFPHGLKKCNILTESRVQKTMNGCIVSFVFNQESGLVWELGLCYRPANSAQVCSKYAVRIINQPKNRKTYL